MKKLEENIKLEVYDVFKLESSSVTDRHVLTFDAQNETCTTEIDIVLTGLPQVLESPGI